MHFYGVGKVRGKSSIKAVLIKSFYLLQNYLFLKQIYQKLIFSKTVFCLIQTILQRHDDEVIKKKFTFAQKNSPIKGDWVNNIKSDSIKYNINISDELITKLTTLKHI